MARGKRGEATPVMRQFLRAKEQFPDAILFFRLGDFYEMFYDDAVEAAELLDITLTSRGKGKDGEAIPMAGVPHHAAAGYVARLLSKGRKVALCEQMGDPKKIRGIVPRQVVRVVTPGLCLEPDALDARTHNYLCAATSAPDGGCGLAVLEVSTGELRACVLDGPASLLAEIARLEPREILLGAGLEGVDAALARALPDAVRLAAPPAEPAALVDALGSDAAAQADEDVPAAGRLAAAIALSYAQQNQPGARMTIGRLGVYDPAAQLVLDEVAVRNLELVRTLSGERSGSLLALLDRTRTPMGARLLRRRLLAPLCDVASIRRRHDAVEALVDDAAVRDAVREALGRVGDLERLATRVSLGLCSPRDLGAIRDGLFGAADVVDRLAARPPRVVDEDPLAAVTPADLCDETREMLATALVDEPPVAATSGGIFRDGQSAELDAQRRLASGGKDLILELERREREQTGISTLKVRFTRVFGYYIEVTRAKLDAVPTHYHRKQTVASGERFTTEELTTLQDDILNAQERAQGLESEMFDDLCGRVRREAGRLRDLAGRLAEIDVHAALADVAHHLDYVRPAVDATTSLALEDARHPIVEQLAAAGRFVPNDVRLDADTERMMIVTGPNMSGKSTVMRQVALAVVMAQAGSFVPARRATIGVVDRVFTRVGASDNLGEGQSTFMVEMREASAILRGATRRSLVILDEIGRGTSTYDGLAIAWAVAEHLDAAIGCRAMFATHYHELCELAALRPGVVNFNVAARERGDDVVFLHRLVPGAANKSYGIAVARLAGVPAIVLARARGILGDLEQGAPLPSGAPSRMRGLEPDGRAQLPLFVPATDLAPSPVEATLRELDVDHLTPLDALVALARLKDMLDA